MKFINYSISDLAQNLDLTEKQVYYYLAQLHIEGGKAKSLGQPRFFTEMQRAELEVGIALKEKERLSYQTIRNILKVLRDNNFSTQVFLVKMDDQEQAMSTNDLEEVWKVLVLEPKFISVQPVPVQKYLTPVRV